MSPVRTSPPRWALRFFKWFCDPDLHPYLEGDLLELYELNRSSRGVSTARWRFILEVIRLFRPGIIKSFEGSQQLNQYGLIKNYYKVSMRNILRHKTFSLLNISGLGVGLASCLLILVFIHHELSYDTYNAKYHRTYRVLQHFGDEENLGTTGEVPTSSLQVWGNAPVAPALKEYFPQIENVFRFTSDFDWLVAYNDQRFQEKGIAFADSTFYQVFDWRWLAGDARSALVRPETMIISRQMAEKYFGDEDPIGKALLMDGEESYEVTGVYEIPPNSHFSFPAFISMATFINMNPDIFTSWGYVDFYTYFTLNDNADIATLEANIPEFLERHASEHPWYTIRFEPLADAYLYSAAGRQPGPTGNYGNIRIFTLVAFFILLIACINFMNLSTARSIERAKEVAIRKTIGSSRTALVFQFLVEAVLLTLFSAVMAVALVWLFHGHLEMLVGKELPVNWLLTPLHLGYAVAFVLGLGLFTGLYPALALSRFTPIKVFKGAVKTSSGGVWLRKSLVVLQFAISIMLISGTAIVYNQLQFLRQYDKGFDDDQVLVIDYGWDGKVQRSLETVKAELLRYNAVVSVAASRATPGDFFPNAGTGIASPAGELVYHGPSLYEIDEDFIPTYGMEMAAGRNFSSEHPSDSATALIVNEAAARLFGYAHPEDIVGQRFEQWGRVGRVIGVVSDFNYVSLHDDVEPLALRYATRWNTSMLSVKLRSHNYQETLTEIEKIWKTLVPHRPFVAHFKDTHFNEQYEADARFGSVFSIFSGLAIGVACLGLFGLTVFSTAQRRKEIGVRKVLGASTQRLVSLLSLDFIKLFLLAVFIAVPVSWYAMQLWLEGFAYRTAVSWEVFALAACCTLGVSLLTMSFNTLSAARANPTASLRDE